MGDIVGAHEPHVNHVKQLVRKVLSEEGVNPDMVDSKWIQAFATSVASLDHKPIEEQEFRRLITEDQRAKHAWSLLHVSS